MHPHCPEYRIIALSVMYSPTSAIAPLSSPVCEMPPTSLLMTLAATRKYAGCALLVDRLVYYNETE